MIDKSWAAAVNAAGRIRNRQRREREALRLRRLIRLRSALKKLVGVEADCPEVSPKIAELREHIADLSPMPNASGIVRRMARQSAFRGEWLGRIRAMAAKRERQIVEAA